MQCNLRAACRSGTKNPRQLGVLMYLHALHCQPGFSAEAAMRATLSSQSDICLRLLKERAARRFDAAR
jgi:hypothetical protein